MRHCVKEHEQWCFGIDHFTIYTLKAFSFCSFIPREFLIFFKIKY